MDLLLIDTCGANGSIALADTTRSPAILATATLPGRTASERLIPAIQSLLAEHETPSQSLAAIVVVHGPGSFTGVRVGLSAAKGLCEALSLPLIAISRLAVLASQAPAGETLALLDAGRGEFYCGHYLVDEALSEKLCTREAILSLTAINPAATLIACEPAVAASLAPLHPQLIPEPTASAALPLALLRINQGAFDDIATLDANYVRRTDAEIFAKPTSAKSAPSTQTSPEPPAR